MGRVIRFRYIDSYQKISNILLYKRLKKTRLLKTAFLCALLFIFLSDYRNLVRLNFFLKKRYRRSKTRRLLKKIFFKRLKKKLSKSYMSLSTFLDTELKFNFISQVAPKSRLDNLKHMLDSSKTVENLLNSSSRFSIDTILSKILLAFLSKDRAPSSISHPFLKQLFLKSNYSIDTIFNSKFLNKQGQGTVFQKLFSILPNKLDLLLIGYFPNMAFLFTNSTLEVFINGVGIDYLNSINSFLTVGDLIRVETTLENTFNLFLYKKTFLLFYMLVSLNRLSFFQSKEIAKRVLTRTFLMAGNVTLHVNSNTYLRSEPPFFFSKRVNSLKVSLKEFLPTSNIINRVFFFEKAISIYSIDWSATDPIEVTSLPRLLDLSTCLKDVSKVAYINRSLRCTTRFLECGTKLKAIQTILTPYKVFSTLLKSFLKLQNISLFRFDNVLNITNLLLNIKTQITSSYAIGSSKLLVYLLYSDKLVINRKGRALRRKKRRTFLYGNLRWKSLSRRIPILHRLSDSSGWVKNFSSLPHKKIFWTNFHGYFQIKNELSWSFFWNSIFDSFNSVGVMYWYTKWSISMFIYSFFRIDRFPTKRICNLSYDELVRLFRY